MTGTTARLLGGPNDGRIVTLNDALLRSGRLLVPAPPTLSAAGYADPWADESTRPALYRWDGTRNDAGEARFRWAP